MRIYVCECGAVSDNPSMEKRVPCGRRSDGWHDPKLVEVSRHTIKLLEEANAKLGEEVERLAHGICDVLKMLDDKATMFHNDHASLERITLRGLLKGTEHEGHRDNA